MTGGAAPTRRAVVLGAVAMAGPLQAQARALRVVMLGDSLTAGFGLPQEAALPRQLERALRARGRAVGIDNAGVSGDTAAQGLARLDWSVPDGTDAVLVALGANDGLRGLDPAAMERALDEIVARLQARRIAVMLLGMMAPRNMGADYVARFDAVQPRIAERRRVPLYPFLLDGVAGDASLNLPDGIHPTARGIGVIVERLLPPVEAFLASIPR